MVQKLLHTVKLIIYTSSTVLIVVLLDLTIRESEPMQENPSNAEPTTDNSTEDDSMTDSSSEYDFTADASSDDDFIPDDSSEDDPSDPSGMYKTYEIYLSFSIINCRCFRY